MKFGLRRVQAFSLVEVTLAIGIAVFCLIAVFGLMPVALQTNRNATSQTGATNIIADVVADLRGTPRCVAQSTQFFIVLGTGPGCSPSFTPIPAKLYFDSTGGFTTSLGTTSRYQLNLTWNVTNLTGSCSPGLPCADLKVTWPAAATPANANGSTEMFAAFDRN